MINIIHFAEDSDTSGFFPQLARWHDRSRYKMYFGTLKPIAPWLRNYMQSQGVECLSCDCISRTQYPFGLYKLASFLRRNNIKILHTHLFDPSVVGLWAGYLARTPVRVMTRHYSDLHTRINKHWHFRIDQMCNRLSHVIIAVSQHTADHLINVEQVPAQKIVTILNGIDFDRVKVSEPQALTRIRKEFGADNTYLILIVARLHPDKGHEFLFRAIQQLQSITEVQFRLVVAGSGSYEEAYRQQVKQLGCSKLVKFVGFRRDVADCMAAADVLVLPTLSEAFGLVLTEAIYLGTPVIATRVGGIPEIVEDGLDGILVPPADSDQLALALQKMMTGTRLETGAVSDRSERIRSRFAFEDMVRAYERVYHSLGV